jgi:nucleoside-diphosphate-sugar epimerase
VKLIITGATGFIGRNLAASFRERGDDIIATGRSPGAGAELRENGLEFRAADVMDPADVFDAFSPADCVIHCAGRYGDRGSYDDFHQTNVIGTRNVVAACARHRIRKIIFMSTPSIYFNGRDRLNISESDPLPAPAGHYAKTKLLAENELLAAAGNGLQVIILRPRAVYGPYDNTFARRVLRLSERKAFPLINDGRALIDITYIGNLIEAVRQCLAARESSWNLVYNISNGQPITLREWFAEMMRVFGRPFKPLSVAAPLASAIAGVLDFASRPPLGFRPPAMTRFSVDYMAKSMTLSLDKARTQLGYVPRFDNRQSFEDYERWYRAQASSSASTVS